MSTAGMFTCGPVRRVIALGALSQLEAMAVDCRRLGVDFRVVTSPDQFPSLRLSDQTPCLVVERIDDPAVPPFLGLEELGPEEFLAISFGARWLMKAPIREALFQQKILNVHASRLPFDRGGGGFSWRIMRGDRLGAMTLHLLDDEIDTGPVVRTAEYVIPARCHTPHDMQEDYATRLHGFFMELIGEMLGENKLYPLHSQQVMVSNYVPRLSTDVHGWINWSWEPNNLVSFCIAFDEPYKGARTLWGKTPIRLRKLQLHCGEVGVHPFQAGLVMRTNGRWLLIALSDGYTMIVEDVSDDDGRSLMSSIKEGDRLYTPSDLLGEAASTRVIIGANGMRIKA